MQAKTDGIVTVVGIDNSTDFSQLLTALPKECRIAIAWGTPDETSGVTLNRIADKIKIVHMYFADKENHSAEYASVGQISPLSSFMWNRYPCVATVTNLGNSKSSKIDDYNLEIRYRYPSESISSEDDQWFSRLGIPVTNTNTETALPKTPELMPNAVPATAEVIPEVQKVAAKTAVEQATNTKEASIQEIIKTAETPLPVAPPIKPIKPVIPVIQEQNKTNYLPWALGGIALLILLRR